MRRCHVGSLFTACAAAAGCGGGGSAPVREERAAAPPWFEDVASASGLDFRHRSGHAEAFLVPEITCGGGGLFDYDGDGDLDVYLVQAGSLTGAAAESLGNRLYRNRGDGTFEDVTRAAGVGDDGYGFGCACGDYDADGDLDLYVTNLSANVLYRNEGDGTFTDVTRAAGVGERSWSSSAAFVDADADGDLDLYVVNYLVWSRDSEPSCRSADGLPDYCPPGAYAPARDTLYENRGDGTFVDASADAGIDQARRNGLGVVCADVNGDGLVDVYVANDANANLLWVNLGGLRFVDQALRAGCALSESGTPEAGMGVAAVDVEHDGDVDLFVTHLLGETNTFYLNCGERLRDATVDLGLALSSRPFTGFGLGFADFDQDGELDLYVANGRVARSRPARSADDPYAEPDLVYRGIGSSRFEERRPRAGAAEARVATSRAAAFGDVDGDGAVDVLVVDRDASVRLLRNVAPERGDWILLRVLDRHGLDAVGSAVEVEAGGRVQRRLVQVASSYLASNDPRVHFGLGAATRVERVTVHWLGRGSEEFGPLDAGAVHELREGARR